MEEDVRRKTITVIMAFLFILSMTACKQNESEQIILEAIQSEQIEKDGNSDENESIFVYVCGAVLHEGVYELSIGSRAYEAIEKAGGFSEDAAMTYINQAEILEDETRLYVPTKEEMTAEQAEEAGKINLNTARKEELMTLPGVGEAKADSIIKYREVNGKFQSIEDIMQISGIKEGLFSKIKDYITV